MECLQSHDRFFCVILISNCKFSGRIFFVKNLFVLSICSFVILIVDKAVNIKKLRMIQQLQNVSVVSSIDLAYRVLLQNDIDNYSIKFISKYLQTDKISTISKNLPRFPEFAISLALFTHWGQKFGGAVNLALRKIRFKNCANLEHSTVPKTIAVYDLERKSNVGIGSPLVSFWRYGVVQSTSRLQDVHFSRWFLLIPPCSSTRWVMTFYPPMTTPSRIFWHATEWHCHQGERTEKCADDPEERRHQYAIKTPTLFIKLCSKMC